MDQDFISNARTDVFAIEVLDAAIERCNRYLDAGADLAFIDGIQTKADIVMDWGQWGLTSLTPESIRSLQSVLRFPLHSLPTHRIFR